MGSDMEQCFNEPFLALFKHQHDHHSEYAMVYSDEIEDKIDQIMLELKHCYPNLLNYRWHALKLLEGDTPMQSCWSPAKKILNPVIAKKFCARIATGDYDAVTTSLLTLPESTAARCGILPMPVQRNARNRSLWKRKTQLNENRSQLA